MNLMSLKALTVGVVFSFVVDYARHLSGLIEAGSFDTVHNNITRHDEYTEDGVWNPFGMEEQVAKEVDFELFEDGGSGDLFYMESVMKRARCRPADAKELLAFAEKNPDLQREIQIVALSSRVIPYTDEYFIAYLGGDSQEREVTFHVFGRHGGAFSGYLFLAVHE